MVRLKRYSEAERSFKAAKDSAVTSSVHNFDEEIRKVRYLISIRECMDPVTESESQQRKGEDLNNQKKIHSLTAFGVCFSRHPKTLNECI